MAEIKRLNYFTSQFLVEEDFKDEQAYHRDMRYRHNQLLHTWGVVDGLIVSKTGDKQVTISPGMAIDQDGKEIILPSEPPPQPLNLSGSGDVYVTIEYQDVKDEADKDTTSGVVNQYRRITERPSIKSTTSQPTNDGSVIVLAKVALDNNGNIVGNIDNSVRTIASAKVANGSVGTTEIANESITLEKLAVSARSIQLRFVRVQSGINLAAGTPSDEFPVDTYDRAGLPENVERVYSAVIFPISGPTHIQHTFLYRSQPQNRMTVTVQFFNPGSAQARFNFRILSLST